MNSNTTNETLATKFWICCELKPNFSQVMWLIVTFTSHLKLCFSHRNHGSLWHVLVKWALQEAQTFPPSLELVVLSCMLVVVHNETNNFGVFFSNFATYVFHVFQNCCESVSPRPKKGKIYGLFHHHGGVFIHMLLCPFSIMCWCPQISTRGKPFTF
jgi:hypothetical protein